MPNFTTLLPPHCVSVGAVFVSVTLFLFTRVCGSAQSTTTPKQAHSKKCFVLKGHDTDFTLQFCSKMAG